MTSVETLHRPATCRAGDIFAAHAVLDPNDQQRVLCRDAGKQRSPGGVGESRVPVGVVALNWPTATRTLRGNCGTFYDAALGPVCA